MNPDHNRFHPFAGSRIYRDRGIQPVDHFITLITKKEPFNGIILPFTIYLFSQP